MTELIRCLHQESSYSNQRFVGCLKQCSLRIFFQFDRSGKKMTVAPIKEEKNYRFQDEIMNACIKAMEEDSIPVVDVSI